MADRAPIPSDSAWQPEDEASALALAQARVVELEAQLAAADDLTADVQAKAQDDERARCLAWVDAFLGEPDMGRSFFRHVIADGENAPAAVLPNSSQVAGSKEDSEGSAATTGSPAGAGARSAPVDGDAAAPAPAPGVALKLPVILGHDYWGESPLGSARIAIDDAGRAIEHALEAAQATDESLSAFSTVELRPDSGSLGFQLTLDYGDNAPPDSAQVVATLLPILQRFGVATVYTKAEVWQSVDVPEPEKAEAKAGGPV